MSARQIKKLRAQEELARKAALAKNGQAGSSSDDSDDDEIQVRPTTRPANAFAAFAALADEGDEEDERDEEEEEEEEGLEGGDDEKPVETETAPAPIPKATAAKKKKKKNNKKKAKKGANNKEDAAGAMEEEDTVKPKQKKAAAKGKQDDLDEIDRALEELRLQNKTTGPAGAAELVPPPPKHGIAINLHNLRVINELRDVFGNTVLTTAHAQEMANGPANPRARGERIINVDLETFFRAPAQGYTHRGLLPSSAGIVAKRNPFIQWKDTWPRATSGGLSMKQVGAPDAHGVVEFAFVHGSEYIALEEQFHTMTLLLHSDPNTIFNFLHQFPFHIASLIVVSILARTHDQNPTLAADLLERALFSFGRATLSSFRTALTDPAGGKARLSFRRPENRQFVLAGYHYIRSLMGRGTFRTALEWIKVFLSLMPDDEQGLLLYAPSAAIQAYEAQWFVDYISTFTEEDDQRADNVWPMLEYIRQSVVPAKLQLNDTAGARAALHAGVARVPWLYGALFQALNMDVPRAVWAVLPRDDVEVLYTEMYLDVAKPLWSSSAAVMDFVKAELAAMPGKPDVAAIPPARPVTQTLARFVYLGNNPALMGLVVPRALLHTQPNSDFDPLPPRRSDNIFSYPSQQRPWTLVEDGGGEGGSASQQQQDQQRAIAAALAAAAGGDGEEGAQGWLDFLRGLVGFGGGGGGGVGDGGGLAHPEVEDGDDYNSDEDFEDALAAFLDEHHNEDVAEEDEEQPGMPGH